MRTTRGYCYIWKLPQKKARKTCCLSFLALTLRCSTVAASWFRQATSCCPFPTVSCWQGLKPVDSVAAEGVERGKHDWAICRIFKPWDNGTAEKAPWNLDPTDMLGMKINWQYRGSHRSRRITKSSGHRYTDKEYNNRSHGRRSRWRQLKLRSANETNQRRADQKKTKGPTDFPTMIQIPRTSRCFYRFQVPCWPVWATQKTKSAPMQGDDPIERPQFTVDDKARRSTEILKLGQFPNCSRSKTYHPGYHQWEQSSRYTSLYRKQPSFAQRRTLLRVQLRLGWAVKPRQEKQRIAAEERDTQRKKQCANLTSSIRCDAPYKKHAKTRTPRILSKQLGIEEGTSVG